MALTICVLDGERCGATLKALFENAANPDKIVVGLVEQNEPEDKFCLEVYCQAFGKDMRIAYWPQQII